MHDSVTRTIPSPVGATPGRVELDYIDGVVDLVPHPQPLHVPRGAPLIVRGWASQREGTAPAAVRILLDRTNVYDVRCADNAPGNGELPFAATIPTGAITPGGHEVCVVVLADDRRWYEAGRRAFAVYEPELASRERSARSARLRVESIVDARADGTRRIAHDAVPVGHDAIVTGWGVDAQTLAPLSRAIVSVRGRRYTGECNLPRPDVRGALGGAGSDRVGFEVLVPAADLGPGNHLARIDCVDADGGITASSDVVIRVASRRRAFPPFATRALAQPAYEAAVRVRAAEADDAGKSASPRASASAHAWQALPSDTLEVSGWADDPWGMPAAEVFLELVRTGDITAIAPHRIAAVSGYRDGSPPRGGAFRIELPLRHETGRVLDLSLLALGPDRRVYGTMRLGTLSVGESG